TAQKAAAPQAEGPRRVPRDGALPLSFAQERLWFLDRLVPTNPFYNVPGAVRLQGVLDVAALEGSLAAIVERRELLRPPVTPHDGQAVQVIHPPGPILLSAVDLRPLPPGEREEAARRLALEEALRPFDLATGPLLRARLLQLDAAEHVLLITQHH